ncbi:hypothetical protein AruPA_04275 [Acidiphilium sp. PA]|uniref:hypothetical protein n=1 Tax=Acidiphilium sp. PA TaxID=2871705 RepID=UPI002244009A|nr:hypothetical protein [Acidiphilium sp. PA]MCW8306244.1 hypothetical protein [Acidiphilium sp. PA]
MNASGIAGHSRKNRFVRAGRAAVQMATAAARFTPAPICYKRAAITLTTEDA